MDIPVGLAMSMQGIMSQKLLLNVRERYALQARVQFPINETDICFVPQSQT